MKMRLLALALLGSVGCTRTISGPTPQVAGATNPLQPGRSPAVVCNAQGASTNGWRLDVTGDGFAPLPINVLTSTSGLDMPVVSLSGASAYELPRERVFFSDKTHLVVQLPTANSNPAQVLPVGTYTVTVTNPDKLSGSMANALIIVPPPTLTSVTPESAFSQTAPTQVTLVGTGFRQDALPTVTASNATNTFQLTGVTFVSTTQLTAQVPANVPAGTYDVTVANPEGCTFTLPGGLVVQYNTLGTLTIEPRFGWQLKNQPITIYNAFTAPQVGFSGGAPQVSITAAIKGGGTVDIPLRRVAYVSPSIITAVVPDCSGLSATPTADPVCPNGIQPGTYALKVRDPSGAAGSVPTSRGFTVVVNQPPQITSISPSAIDTNGISDLLVNGTNFGTGAVVQLVFQVTGTSTQVPGSSNLRACTLPTLASPAPTAIAIHASVPTSVAASNCTEVDALGNAVTPGGGLSLSAGLYVVRVQNTTDPAYADFSGLIVTNPAANPEHGPAITTLLSTARADFPLVEATDDLGNPFLYAVGGTDGTNLLSTVEVAPLTLFGDVGGDCSSTPCKFRALDRTQLGFVGATGNTAQGRKGVAAVVRTVPNDTSYIFVIGGQAASGELSVVERAQVLRSVDAPNITSSLTTGGSLGGGTYYYRVSAILLPGDTNNPGGETLPSDEESQTVDASGGGKVALSWLCMSGVAQYRIYRSPSANAVSGSERLLTTVNATAGCSGSESFFDDGSLPAPGSSADKPLPPGALSRWVSQPALATRRYSPAAKVVGDQLYVAGGSCTNAGVGCATAGTQSSVERSTFTGNATGAFSLAGAGMATARQHFTLSVADAATAPAAFSTTNSTDIWLMAVGGDQGSGPVGSGGGVVEVAKVVGGGSVITTPTFSASSYSASTPATHGGWSEVIANIFFLAGPTGGTSGTGFTFRSNTVCNGAQCTATNSFSGTLNGVGTAGAYTTPGVGPRYLGGEDLFRAYIYIAGGFPSDTGGTPTATLERFIY